MASIRLLVVDDHEVARRGIRSVLAGNRDIEIVAETADGEAAIERVRDLHPEIVLLDISLPGMSGIEAARRIREISPTTCIVFLSQHDSISMARNAMSAGPSCYVVKSDAGHDLLTAIEAARDGRAFVSRTLASRGWKPDPEHSQAAPLQEKP